MIRYYFFFLFFIQKKQPTRPIKKNIPPIHEEVTFDKFEIAFPVTLFEKKNAPSINPMREAMPNISL